MKNNEEVFSQRSEIILSLTRLLMSLSVLYQAIKEEDHDSVYESFSNIQLEEINLKLNFCNIVPLSEWRSRFLASKLFDEVGTAKLGATLFTAWEKEYLYSFDEPRFKNDQEKTFFDLLANDFLLKVKNSNKVA